MVSLSLPGLKSLNREGLARTEAIRGVLLLVLLVVGVLLLVVVVVVLVLAVLALVVVLLVVGVDNVEGQLDAVGGEQKLIITILTGTSLIRLSQLIPMATAI